MGVLIKMFLSFAVWFFCLTACGSDSDSSSSSAPEGDELSEDDTPRNTKVDAKAKDAPVIYGKIQDNWTGDSIATIQVGTYIWLTQNTTRKGWGTFSTCYDKDDSNCDHYGRLYQPEEEGHSCPEGFGLPTENDWKALSKYNDKYPEVSVAMQMKYGGYCIDDIDTVLCKDLDKAGKYLTREGVAVFKPGSFSPAFEDTVPHGLYQMRCVAYTHIVAGTKELPECDSTVNESLGNFYVVNEKSNYRCLGNRWVDDFNDNCSHVVDRTAVTVNDTLYICKDEIWQVATISESREICDDKNDSTTLLFNGERYVCEDSSWRRFTDIEEKLGYCHGDLVGSFDSLKTRGYDKEELDSTTKYVGYYCSKNGWRKAVLTDYAGDCDSTKAYKTFKFMDTTFICRNRKWDTFTSLEKELDRPCTPKNQGKIDTTADDIAYTCDENSWRRSTMTDYIGECDSTKIEKTAKYNDTLRYCTGSQWRLLDNLEKELGICTKSIADSLVRGKDGNLHLCTPAGKWIIPKLEDIHGKCDSTRVYETVVFDDKKYFCLDKSWKSVTFADSVFGLCTPAKEGKTDSVRSDGKMNYYNCHQNYWSKITYLETLLDPCGSDNKDEKKSLGDSVYVCDGKDWKLGSVEDHLGACTSSKENDTGLYKGVTYVCHSSAWVKLNNIEKNHGICRADICGARVQEGNAYYNCNCENKPKWVQIDKEIWDLGSCATDTSYFRETEPSWWYRCNNGTWSALTTPDEVYGSCSSDRVRTGRVRDKLYGCDPDNLLWMKWYALEDIDTVKGYCRKTMQHDTLFFNNSYYMCDSNKTAYRPVFIWREVTIREYMRDCNTASEGKVMYNGFNQSKCTSGKWSGIPTGTMTDTRDNRTYNVLTVDGISWMVDNLAYSTDSSWCIENASNCSNGRLYAWSSAQKACPSGWRLPSISEWSSTIAFLDAIGNKYAITNAGWNGITDDDIYGMNITPTGFYESYMQNGSDPMATQAHTKDGAMLWTESGYELAFGSHLKPDSSAQYVNAKIIGRAVRCVK